MKARLYFAAVLFFMPSRERKPHTDPTVFLGLTQIPQISLILHA